MLLGPGTQQELKSLTDGVKGRFQAQQFYDPASGPEAFCQGSPKVQGNVACCHLTGSLLRIIAYQL